MKKKYSKKRSKKGKAKRVNHRKGALRRGIMLFIFRVFSVSAIIAAVCTAVTIFFKITVVNVIGETRYDSREIVRLSGIETGRNMFTFNKFQSLENIKQGLPYIKDVSIKRALPSTVEIRVTECKPAAVIITAGEKWITDINGKLLEKVESDGDGKPDGLVEIIGAELDNPQCGSIFELTEKDKKKPLIDILQTAENNAILQKVSSVNIGKIYRIALDYDGRFTVKVGSSSNLEKKIRFLKSIEARLVSTDKGVIDISDTRTARFIPDG